MLAMIGEIIKEATMVIVDEEGDEESEGTWDIFDDVTGQKHR
jgi:hypothetical protein